MLALAVVLVACGLLLARTGRWPRPSGTAPHCSQCGYNLTGLDLTAATTCCPECGVASGPKTVVIGERRRRRWLVATGGVLFLLGLGAFVSDVTGKLAKVDWYAYKPTALVIADIGSSDERLAAKALAAIKHRLEAQRVAPKYVRKLADACLTEQCRPTPRRGICETAVTLLADLESAGKLTAEQRNTFWANLMQFTLDMRRKVIAGRPFVVTLLTSDRAPRDRFYGEITTNGVTWGHKGAGSGTSQWRYTLIPGSAGKNLWWCPPLDEPGLYPVVLDFTLRVYSDWKQAEEEALYSSKRRLEGLVEVVAGEPADLIGLTYSPEMDEYAAKIALREARPSTSPIDGGQLFVTLAFPGQRPIGFAFELFAEVDGRRVPIGSNVVPKNGGTGSLPIQYCCFQGFWRGEFPPRVTIVARSSPDVAHWHAEVDEIWDGELWFEDVEIPLRDEHWQPGYKPRLPQVRRRSPTADGAAAPASAPAATQPPR